MTSHTYSQPRFPRQRKFWGSALATGAVGTTIGIWFEEFTAFVGEFLGVILLAILGGLICLFDLFVFKSHVPRQKDKQDTTINGVKN